MTRHQRKDLATPLARRILEHVRDAGLPPGTHLRAQDIAQRLSVSRFPVGQALQLLAGKGAVEHRPNRGYFLAQGRLPTAETLGLEPEQSQASDAYFRIAEDHLQGRLPARATEIFLRESYGLTRAELSDVLRRMAEEGWAARRAGYGWSFLPVLTTPESLEQTYRLRLALEPAALLEPGYHLSAEAIATCRAAEERLLAGAIDTDSPDALHERGVRFHETLVAASGNPFFLDTIRRLNRIRRLLSYRSMLDRRRYRRQCEEHLAILDYLAHRRQEEAAALMRLHLSRTIDRLAELRPLLSQPSASEAS
ncbi:GntR family transcriptional regulator [Bosea sp. MMO-172]|uniref:GntR family transcriptional regulator n=1 Tax=Bosea sp. MMO-172 TaxID=3127885 RepID=UPI0030171B1D